MKTLIRHSVFETNSSSCHSISLDNSVKLKDIPTPNKEGVIHLRSDDFGWEYATYNDFNSKAAYLIVYIRDWSRDKKEEFRDIFESVLKKNTGCEKIVYERNFWEEQERTYTDKDGNLHTYLSGLGEGHIDHQSVEDGDLHYMFEDVTNMEQFLFSSNSVLTTDNDNH